MNILFITEIFPYPLDTGGKIVTYQMLRMLAPKHKITLVALSSVNPTKSELKKMTSLGIKPIIILSREISSWYKSSRLETVRLIFQKRPIYCSNFYKKLLLERVQNLLISTQFDIIHIDHLSMAQYLPKTKSQTRILHEHNIEHLLQWELIKTSHTIQGFALHLYNAISLSIYEKKIFHQFDQIITLSESDKAKLVIYGVPTQKILVIPPGVSQNKKSSKRNTKELLFIGNLWWKPNLDAIVWFLQKIFPVIQKQNKSITLTVIGEGIHLLSSYKNDQITLLDKQPHINKYLQRADAFILPFRIGQGVRIKAITALSYGIPIVSTSIGMRGLSVQNNREYLEANSPIKFAKQIIRLTSDKSLQTLLSQNAPAYTKRSHSQSIIKTLMAHYGF